MQKLKKLIKDTGIDKNAILLLWRLAPVPFFLLSDIGFIYLAQCY